MIMKKEHCEKDKWIFVDYLYLTFLLLFCVCTIVLMYVIWSNKDTIRQKPEKVYYTKYITQPVYYPVEVPKKPTIVNLKFNFDMAWPKFDFDIKIQPPDVILVPKPEPEVPPFIPPPDKPKPCEKVK